MALQVWELYLKKGQYETALQYCKVHPSSSRELYLYQSLNLFLYLSAHLLHPFLSLYFQAYLFL
jgi:hypothetical protein